VKDDFSVIARAILDAMTEEQKAVSARDTLYARVLREQGEQISEEMMAARLPAISPDPIGTTPRKNLTPLQRLALLEAYGHCCALCGAKIDTLHEKWRDEHLRALGLGGVNDFGDRGPVHVRCAADKDIDDNARIKKAKRQKAVHVGAKEKTGRWPTKTKPEKTERRPPPGKCEMSRRFREAPHGSK
jgi:hypothetical protein